MKKTGRPGTVAHLLRKDSKVYIYCKSENICRRFFMDAEAEGFTFGDGIKPTEKETSDIFALCDDWTISYTGFAAHMMFRSQDSLAKKSPARIDYGKYLSGAKAKDYRITKSLPQKPRAIKEGSKHETGFVLH